MKLSEKSQKSTEKKEEIEKFASLAGEWYLANGSFEMLHKMNKLRVQYILSHEEIGGKKILDIGCGGGILSEELASLGGIVTALDPCKESIDVAINNSRGEVNYISTSLEKYREQNSKFDVVCIMEVIEHVDNPQEFVSLCAGMLAPGGKIFFSTLNKTIKSFLFGIVAAEYLLRIVPKGTHSWKNFLSPSTLNRFFSQLGLEISDIAGLSYSILSDSWCLSEKIKMNYLGFASCR